MTDSHYCYDCSTERRIALQTAILELKGMIVEYEMELEMLEDCQKGVIKCM